MSIRQNLNRPILRGDTFMLPIRFKQVTGQSASIAGRTLIFTLKLANDLVEDTAAPVYYNQTLAVDDPASLAGGHTVVLGASVTSQLKPVQHIYQIQLITPDETEDIVRTFRWGSVSVKDY